MYTLLFLSTTNFFSFCLVSFLLLIVGHFAHVEYDAMMRNRGREEKKGKNMNGLRNCACLVLDCTIVKETITV